MKKLYIIIIVFVILVLGIMYLGLSRNNFANSDTMCKGNLLMTDYNKNAIKGIKIYSLEEHSELDFIADGSKGLFLNETMILFKRGNTILSYDIKNSVEKIVYTDDEYIDDFSLYSQNKIVVYQNGNAVIQDIYSNETEQLSLKNLMGEISVNKDGTIIYYCDGENIVKYDVQTKTSSIIEKGTNPKIYNDKKIAFRNSDGNLVVKDLISNDVWKYNGQAYNYCFSPCGKFLAIEDEMSLQTGILNLFKKQRVLGHKVAIWEYETNKTQTIIESCEAGIGTSFSWESNITE